MLPFFRQSFGNPAALYSVGMDARSAVETARAAVAAALNASPDEIVFTSGGTESDNSALWGVAMANVDRPRHMITTSIEHHAVLEPLETLARNGCDVDILSVQSDGRLDPCELRRRIRKETLLVSVMHANNEIGSIQPIADIGAHLPRRRRDLSYGCGAVFRQDPYRCEGNEHRSLERQRSQTVWAKGHWSAVY